MDEQAQEARDTGPAPIGMAAEAAVLREAARILAKYRGGLGTPIAVLNETAKALEDHSK